MTSQLSASRDATETCVSAKGAQDTVIGDLKSNVERCATSLNATRATLAATSAAAAAKAKALTADKEECLVKSGAAKTMIDDLESDVGRCEKSLNATRADLKETTEFMTSQVKELSERQEFLVTQGGAFKTVIEDLEEEVKRAEAKTDATKAQLANQTAALNAEVKQLTEEKAKVLVAAGASATKIANLEEEAKTCGDELGDVEAEFKAVRATLAGQVDTCDKARDACHVASGAHDAIMKDMRANVARMQDKVDGVNANLQDTTHKLTRQIENCHKTSERFKAQIEAHDEVVADAAKNVTAAGAEVAACFGRETALVGQLASANELKEACTAKHAGLDTKVNTLEADNARLEKAADTETAAHAETKRFYEAQSAACKAEIVRVEALKNDAEKTAGVASESASALAEDVAACEAQIEVNKKQTVEDKASLVTRADALDALVSGLRANNTQCMVKFSRMENVATATQGVVTKCYAELNVTKAKATEMTYYADKVEEELKEIAEDLAECEAIDLPTEKMDEAAPPPPPAVEGSSPTVTFVQGGVTTVVEASVVTECDAAKQNLTALMSENWCRPPLREILLNAPDATRSKSCVLSDNSPGTGHDRGVLYSDQGWTACKNDDKQWYVMDAGSNRTVVGVVMQARRNSNERVTKYKVAVGPAANGPWTYVDGADEFSGVKYDRTEHVEEAKFATPVEARFVRIEPTAWNARISMRVGLLYSPKVGETFTLNPEEADRDYSTTLSNAPPGTGWAKSALDSEGAWIAGANRAGEWMTMDSGRVQTIAGVAMQSRRNSHEMVRVFKVLVSDEDDDDYEYVDDGRLFVGNTNYNEVEEVLFADPVRARYVRIEVVDWSRRISMRAGLVAIEGPLPPPKKRVIPDPDTIIGMNPPDEARIMSSSYHNDKSGYRYNTGMLDSNQGWLSASNDNKQFYIMDAGHVMSIMGVVLQNRKNQDQYVEIYKVSVSNELRGPYMEVDNGAAFVGNTKRSDEKAEALFMEPVTARYVRIEPIAYRGHTAMRCGLKVIKDSIVEDLPALPESKLLNPPDAARSASSSLHNDKSGYRYFTSMLDSREGWLAGRNAPGEYLTIDAGEVRPISAVVTQRRRGHNEMVTKFKVLTSENADGPFTYVADGATYIGTTYLEGEEKGEAVFPEPVSARFVRIEVVSFTRRVTLRAGLKYMREPPPPYPCAKEGGECPCAGGEVYFGKAPATTSPSDKASFEAMLESTHAKTAGGKHVTCAVETFGGDPLPEKIKSCYCVPPLPALPKVLNPPDDARYASSSYGNDVPGYRYNTGMLDGEHGWLAARNAAGETYTMDAGAVMDVAGVVTQGRRNSAEQVTEFKVKVSNFERGPFYYVDGGEVFKNYVGYDAHVESHFSEPVKARYVQIEATKWSHRVTLRAGLLVMAGTEQPAVAGDDLALAVNNPPELAREYSSIHSGHRKGTGHAQSMLDSNVAWVAQHRRAGEWMTIDAGKKMTIEGVVTQSRRNSNQMVTKFKVLTSDELNGEYTYVANGGVFEGNTIRDEQVMVEFPEPVEARFVRLEVVAWNEYCAMRAALVYKPKDGDRFVFNPEENARTYSSVHGNQKPGTGHARSTLNSDQAWSAGGRNPGEWMTMDSGAVQTIAGVAVQSRRNSDQMVRTFKVLVSNASSTDFTYVDDGRLFVGNSVREVVENVKFADPVSARYVRIEVQTYNQYPSMRAGILIRQGPCPPPKKRVIPDPDTIIGMNPPDEARIMSSSYHNDKSGYRYNTGMLDSNQGWLSASNDNKQFYIMDAGHVMSIMGVVLQNRKNQDQYVEIYKVSVSNELRGPYMEVDNGAAFVGNTKRSDEKAEALFMEPVTARYVRIEPIAYRGHTAMRCGLKVIKDSIVEDLPALPESKLLNPPDAARSASSSLHNDKSGYRYFTSMLDSREGWLAGRNAPGEYLTIDAGEVRPISAVVTQRRRGHNEMVTKFKVLTSENADGPFTYVADGATYIGTTYLEGEEKGEAVFPEPVSARFVRIEVVSFTRRVTLRAGLKYMLKPTSAADAVSSVGAAPFTSLKQLKAAVESCMSVGDKSGKECCSKHGADCGPAGKTDMPGWNVSQMTSLESLFGWPSGWGNFQEDLSAWDTSSVTNIASLFRSSSYNPGPKVDAWDVSKVTNMDYAFYKSRFNQPLSGWDVRNVQKAHELFTYNAVFAQDITMWDMPNIGDKGLHRTFDGSGAFTKAFVNCGNPSDAESIPECAGKEFPFSKGGNDGPPGAWTKRN